MLTYFHEIYTKVAEYLTTTGQFDTQVVQVNPKGDQTKAFDYNTEAMILDYFEKQLPFAVKVLTEERGEIDLGSGAPEYTIIIDPVDGSDNFTRKLGMTGFSVATIPSGEPLTVENVKYGFVGHLFLKKIFTFEKGKGAFCNEERLFTSKETSLQHALVSLCAVGKKSTYLEQAHPLLQHLTNLRCFGSAAYEICQVAAGGLEAYIDVRSLCTPENFIAAAPMLIAAGGVVTDERGEPLAPIEQLDHGYNVVMSANHALHDSILQYLA